MSNFRIIALVCFALLLALPSFQGGDLVAASDHGRQLKLNQEKTEYMHWLKRDKDSIPVIVRLIEGLESSDTIIETIPERRRRILRRALRKSETSMRNFRAFRNPRLRSFTVSETELDALLSDDELAVYPNRIHTPSLTQSVPLVFPNQATSEFDGSDLRVVVIDTGVDSSHSFLAGAVATGSAACFSNDGNAGGIVGHFPASQSLCPGGAVSVVSSTAGEECNSALIGCDHGTQMAGIIAGDGATSNGVAPGAQVIPIQVFTQINDDLVCDSLGFLAPCIGATTADLLAALEYVNSSLNLSDVAAVNISFGTSFTSQGQCESALESTIDQIVNAGVAVIASSGNGGSDLAMTAPACINSVVSVASTDINNVASDFNNRNSELDFFAPGEGITTSTLPASQFGDVQDVPAGGTSAAAAHIAGAWAVMKSKNPTATVATIKANLENTGIDVTQSQGTAVTAPRINLEAALNALPEFVPDEEFCFPIRASNGNVAVVCL